MKLWNWTDDGTKILGALVAIKDIAIGLIAIEGLIPTSYIKYVAALGVILGVLTVRRGIANTKAATLPAPSPEAARSSP